MPRSSNAGAGSRWAATPPTPATPPTSCRTAALAAGIARDTRLRPQQFGAHQAFELATIAGAEAIGMADRIGSLEVGKQADIVVHDASGAGWTPRGDVAMQLVWGTDGRSGTRRLRRRAPCRAGGSLRDRRRRRIAASRPGRGNVRCSNGQVSASLTCGRMSMLVDVAARSRRQVASQL